jgi:hypothetical protein
VQPLAEAGELARTAPSTATANSGINPTMERVHIGMVKHPAYKACRSKSYQFRPKVQTRRPLPVMA